MKAGQNKKAIASVFKRSLWCTAALSFCLCLSAVPAGSAPKKLKPFDIPPRGFFVDLVGPDKQIKTDDSADMALRFASGPRVAPRNAMVMDSPELQDWVDSMADIQARYLEVYNEGAKPAPYSMPIYIVTDHDINCLVVREDAEEDGKSENTTMFGFLDSKPKASTASPLDAGAAPPETPSRVEMRCTHDALVEIGGGPSSDQLDGGRSEIAFVLAHELAHVLLGHFKLAEAQARKQRDLTTLLGIGVTIATLANSKYRRSGSTLYVDPTPQASKDSTKVLVAAYFINDLNVAILGPKYAREQERQADFLAVDLMHRAGGNLNINSAANVLGKWAAAEKTLKQDQPSFASQLAATLANSALVQVTNGQSGKNVINSLTTQAALLAYKHWRDGAVSHVHDDSDARVAAISDYIENHYVSSGPDMSKLQDESDASAQVSAPAVVPAAIQYPSEAKIRGFNPWDGKTFAAAALPQIQAEQLLKEMDQGDCEKLSPGSEAFLRAEATRTVRSQAENYALGAYQNCLQKWNDAVPYFRDAAQGSQKKSEYYLAYVDILQRTGRFEESLATLDEAETTAPKRQAYIVPRISSLVALNRSDEAQKLAEDCKKNQNIDLATQCMATVGKTYDGQPLPEADPADNPPVRDDASSKNFLKSLLGGTQAAGG